MRAVSDRIDGLDLVQERTCERHKAHHGNTEGTEKTIDKRTRSQRPIPTSKDRMGRSLGGNLNQTTTSFFPLSTGLLSRDSPRALRGSVVVFALIPG